MKVHGLWRRWFARSLALGFMGLAIGLFASWWVAGSLVAAVPRSAGKVPSDLHASGFETPSESGSNLSGWVTRPSDCRGVIVLLHGIRGSRRSMLQRARFLHAAGYATVSADFQAHGESPGDRITLGHLEQHDARAAVEFARGEFPKLPIGVLGVSLGGASALLASPMSVDAVIIESVYTDIDKAIHNRVAQRLGRFEVLPAELLLAQLQPRIGVSREQLRPIDHIADVGCPVLIVSGSDDAYTTADETQAMFEAALEPKEIWVVHGAGHVDLLPFSPEEYKRRIIEFFGRHLSSVTESVGRGSEAR